MHGHWKLSLRIDARAPEPCFIKRVQVRINLSSGKLAAPVHFAATMVLVLVWWLLWLEVSVSHEMSS